MCGDITILYVDISWKSPLKLIFFFKETSRNTKRCGSGIQQKAQKKTKSDHEFFKLCLGQNNASNENKAFVNLEKSQLFNWKYIFIHGRCAIVSVYWSVIKYPKYPKTKLRLP